MKALIVCSLVGALMLAGCGGGDDEDASGTVERQAAAVAAVQKLVGDDPSIFTPPIGEEYNCTINFPPQYTDVVPVNARCRYETERQGEDWLVTFREVWACDDFAADDDRYPPCDTTFGFHEWEYLVQLNLNQAQLLDETGQFPPDYIR